MDKQFIAGIAEILEIEESKVEPSLALEADNWNSLAIVSTIALADELYSVLLNGQALGKCQRLSDVTSLIEKAKGRR